MDGGVSSSRSGGGRTIRSQSTIVHRMGLGWDEGFQNSGALDEEEDEDSNEGTLLTTQHGQATRIGSRRSSTNRSRVAEFNAAIHSFTP